MIIGGIRKFSTLDYPGNICVTVFTKGCNFRCPFCHNAPLVLGGEPNSIEINELLAFLKKRAGLVDAVCLTGGEPLINNQDDVLNLLSEIKSLGYKVKLDTNGSYPKKLEYLINHGVIDYVAMDIKNAPSAYAETCGVTFNSELGTAFNAEFGIRNSELGDNHGFSLSVESIKESASILMNGNIDFEFRTTVLREFHTIERMIEIGKWLKGNQKYFLQMFVGSENTIKGGLTPYSEAELEELRQAVLPYIPNTQLRGV